MRIKKMIGQSRRDFTAVYECESCGATEQSYGYDDRNFHDNVIPAMKCKACGQSRNSLGVTAAPTSTRYAEWETV